VHWLGLKRSNKKTPRPIIVKFVSNEKRNEFLTNKQQSQNIEGSRYSFSMSYEDLTPPWNKILSTKSFSDVFISCYNRNSNIKAKLKTNETGQQITITSLDEFRKHGIDMDPKQMGCEELLSI